MITQSRYRIYGLVITIGALFWLIKIAVIVASGGEETVSGVPAVLYLLGQFLMMGGAIALALHLTRDRQWIIRLGAGLLALPAIFLTIRVPELLIKPLIPARWPDYMEDETSLAVTALAWMVASLGLVFSRRQGEPSS